MRVKPRELTIRLLILLLCLIWGSTWLVIQEGLADLPPFTSLAARFTLAGIVLAMVAPRLARIEGGGRPDGVVLIGHSILTLAVPYAVIYWGETRLPSGLVSVLWSIYPILLALSAHLLLPEERMRPRQWLGLFLGLLGVAAMFWTDVRNIGPEAVAAGLIVLISPAASALGTPLIKRRGGATSSAILNRDGSLIAAVLVALLAWTVEGDRDAVWSGAAIFSVVYLALVGTVLAFGIYLWVLRHAPATQLGLIAFGIPLVALTLGAVVGDEPVHARTFVGVALILSGVGLVNLRRSRE